MEDGEFDRACFADLRAYPQRQPYVFALNGLKWVDRTVGGVVVGVLTCNKRHVLTDNDFGFLVVQGEQGGRGQNIAVAVLL